jgi:hypothetical protein
MFLSIFTLLFLFFLYPLSSSHPQSARIFNSIPIHWKIGGLSFQTQNSSTMSARFLLFQKNESPPCNGAATLSILFNPICLLMVLSFKPSWSEIGLVCQGGSRGHRNAATWFTCDEYTKPPRATGGKGVPEAKRQQLRWRISDIKDGAYITGSTPIYNSLSKGQSNISRGFYSAKLEIVQAVLGSELVNHPRILKKRSDSAPAVQRGRRIRESEPLVLYIT